MIAVTIGIGEAYKKLAEHAARAVHEMQMHEESAHAPELPAGRRRYSRRRGAGARPRLVRAAAPHKGRRQHDGRCGSGQEVHDAFSFKVSKTIPLL